METLRDISKVHTPAHVLVCVYIHILNYCSVSYPFNCILKFIETEFVIKFILKRKSQKVETENLFFGMENQWVY